MLLPLIAALASSLAVIFLMLMFAGLRTSAPAAARIERIRAEVRREDEGDESFGDRIALPVARGVGRAVLGILPHSIVRQIEKGLVEAGSPMTAPGFILLSLLVPAMVALLAVVVVFRGMSFSTPVSLVILALAIVAGLAIMPMWLRRKIADRRARIWRSLPDAADLLTTCVEAGMGIDAAITRVAAEIRGPLQGELRTGMQEIALGKPRAEAFTDIGLRTGVDDLQTMLGAIIQAEESGTSLGGVLRVQSQHIRRRRRLNAQERARMVPAKMVFPIVFLIVPTVFLLIIGPLAVELMETFTVI